MRRPQEHMPISPEKKRRLLLSQFPDERISEYRDDFGYPHQHTAVGQELWVMSSWLNGRASCISSDQIGYPAVQHFEEAGTAGILTIEDSESERRMFLTDFVSDKAWREMEHKRIPKANFKSVIGERCGEQFWWQGRKVELRYPTGSRNNRKAVLVFDLEKNREIDIPKTRLSQLVPVYQRKDSSLNFGELFSVVSHRRCILTNRSDREMKFRDILTGETITIAPEKASEVIVVDDQLRGSRIEVIEPRRIRNGVRKGAFASANSRPGIVVTFPETVEKGFQPNEEATAEWLEERFGEENIVVHYIPSNLSYFRAFLSSYLERIFISKDVKKSHEIILQRLELTIRRRAWMHSIDLGESYLLGLDDLDRQIGVTDQFEDELFLAMFQSLNMIKPEVPGGYRENPKPSEAKQKLKIIHWQDLLTTLLSQLIVVIDRLLGPKETN